jgi:predicted GNAT family acetyltransferase
MDMQHTSGQVQNNTAANRFEVELDGTLATIEYMLDGDTITFTHTKVPEALEGRGIASRMAHAALEYARTQYLKVVPICPFVASYIRRHQEYLSLVPPGHRARGASSEGETSA